MQRVYFLVILVILFEHMNAQSYTSYFTGDEKDVTTNSKRGICLMGGASEQDDAMAKFLQYADGGDVVVLRASGSDGYNNYLFSGLGVDVNSVESIVMHDADAGSNAYIIRQVSNAEALWFAGGDQYNYVQYIRDTPLEDTINYLVNVKKIPIGGTSAGMAIMGEGYFPAANGTITSKEAIGNPYHPNMSLGYADFLDVPFMERTITDTHYDRVDSDNTVRREGRHITFMARLAKDFDILPLGIACEEYTAIFVDTSGIASVYGDSGEDDYAYFLKVAADSAMVPEVCEPGEPLTWNYGQKAIMVYRIKGDESGTGKLDLNDWKTGSGGEWFYYFVFLGKFYERETTSVELPVNERDKLKVSTLENGSFAFEAESVIELVSVYDISGKQLFKKNINRHNWTFRPEKTGAFIVALEMEDGYFVRKVMN